PHDSDMADVNRMRNPAGACFLDDGYQARNCRVAGVNPVGTQSREDTSTMVDNSERSIALVVEDDPWIRLLLRDLLTDEGYAVLEASNGSAALRLAQRQPPALVLLDLVLPEQSGLELLAELKSTRATARVPVIAVSARTDLLARAAELADAVVAKPLDIEELLAKISAARRRSCPGANVPKFIASARTWQHAANRGGLQKRT